MFTYIYIYTHTLRSPEKLETSHYFKYMLCVYLLTEDISPDGGLVVEELKKTAQLLEDNCPTSKRW